MMTTANALDYSLVDAAWGINPGDWATMRDKLVPTTEAPR